MTEEEKPMKKRWIIPISIVILMVLSYAVGNIANQPCEPAEEKDLTPYYPMVEKAMAEELGENFFGTAINCYDRQLAVVCYAAIFEPVEDTYDDLKTLDGEGITVKVEQGTNTGLNLYWICTPQECVLAQNYEESY